MYDFFVCCVFLQGRKKQQRFFKTVKGALKFGMQEVKLPSKSFEVFGVSISKNNLESLVKFKLFGECVIKPPASFYDVMIAFKES